MRRGLRSYLFFLKNIGIKSAFYVKVVKKKDKFYQRGLEQILTGQLS